MVSLNNTYAQCVDNDMFVAKKLLNKVNGNSVQGPKLVLNEEDIAKLPDGAKFFGSSGDSNVM